MPLGAERGRHGHFKTKMALVATSGHFKVRVNNGTQNSVFELKKFETLLMLNPEDWHVLYDFSPDCVVTVFASEEYDKEDYFYAEPM
ncbi:TDP-4-oxo-6-deoxy-alpha-D-glucose-3,4-oxoisomerase [compost metagenome]